MKIKIQIQDIIILIALASTLLYVVVFRLPEGVRSFRFFWGQLVLISIILTYPRIFVKSPMKYLLLYGLISVGILQYYLWNHMDDWSRSLFLDEFYALVVFTAILCCYRAKGNFKRLAFISKWAFIFIIITLVLTNVALSMDSLIVREATAGFNDNAEQIRIHRLLGSAG